MLVGMGWVVVEEREEYETLKYVYASPVGIFTYLWGRSTVKFVQASISLVLILAAGWLVMGLSWDWSQVRWVPLVLSIALGLTAVVHFGFLVAGWALVLPRAAISLNEGVAAGLYLLCGVIFPIDLLPHGLRELSLLIPFTYWYEALRRFLLGHSASTLLAAWSDTQLLGALALFVWLAVEPGAVRSIAYNVMLICGVSTLLFNGNPLLRFDGYYVLADWLEIPNLGQRSVGYLGHLAQRHVFGMRDLPSPAPARGPDAVVALPAAFSRGAMST